MDCYIIFKLNSLDLDIRLTFSPRLEGLKFKLVLANGVSALLLNKILPEIVSNREF